MGGTMTANMLASGLRTLNRTIDAWRAKSLYVHALTNVTANFSGSGATVGSGQTINTDAPLRFVDSCYYVKSGTSYPLPLWTQKQYFAITSKTEVGEHPEGFYFDGNVPGVVHVWPVPSASVEYHFVVMKKLSEFADADTAYSLPDGYKAALYDELCVRLPAVYAQPTNPIHVQASIVSRNAIKRNNTKPIILSAEPDVGQRENIISG
jgi:hypothetical protein